MIAFFLYFFINLLLKPERSEMEMMRRVLLLIVLSAWLSTSASSQVKSVNIGGSFSGSFMLSGGSEAVYEITGSPYLSETWMFGSLEMKGDLVKEARSDEDDKVKIDGLFRYNLYAQEFEMVYNRDTFAITAPFNVKSISISNMNFLHGLYVKRGGSRPYLGSAYFQVLNEGECKLLLRHDVKISAGGGPVTYNWAGGADAFVQYQQLYYQESEGAEVVLLKKRRKSIRKLFADRSDEVEKFVKMERININDNAGLARVFNYYNSLDS
jgi:hypothetical protein